jgi:hypothetical protein
MLINNLATATRDVRLTLQRDLRALVIGGNKKNKKMFRLQ